MAHVDLPDAGRVSHFEIDARLPTNGEKEALGGSVALPADLLLAHGQALYFLASGETEAESDGNWRIMMDGADLVTQVRVTGSWVTEVRHAP